VALEVMGVTLRKGRGGGGGGAVRNQGAVPDPRGVIGS
jgi:hypothetical protein